MLSRMQTTILLIGTMAYPLGRHSHDARTSGPLHVCLMHLDDHFLQVHVGCLPRPTGLAAVRKREHPLSAATSPHTTTRSSCDHARICTTMAYSGNTTQSLALSCLTLPSPRHISLCLSMDGRTAPVYPLSISAVC